MTPGSQYIMVIGCIFLFTYSLKNNSIGDAGAQALVEGLQHCTKLQNLE